MGTDFSSLIFGKSLTELTLHDIQQYFKEARTESDKLEYKSFPSNLTSGSGKDKEEEKKILKTIAAFLNSEGGALIWGAPQGVVLPGQKEEVFKDNLMPINNLYEKDAFISKLANRIIPSPKGIQFHRIEDQGKYIYVIEVPPSEYAPHQFENVYYMRVDGQTLAAPHHYIEALFRKISFPKLEAYLTIGGYSHENSDNSRLNCTIYFRNLSRYQNDFNLHCRVVIEQGMIISPGKAFSPMNSHIKEGSDHHSSCITDVIYYGNYQPYSFDVIFSRTMLHEMDYEVLLVVTFGAKHSPMKLCRYTIKIGPNTPAKGRSAIVGKQENLFFHENENEIGMTDVEKLERILNS